MILFLNIEMKILVLLKKRQILQHIHLGLLQAIKIFLFHRKLQ